MSINKAEGDLMSTLDMIYVYITYTECPQVRQKNLGSMVIVNNVQKNSECWKHILRERWSCITEIIEPILGIKGCLLVELRTGIKSEMEARLVR